MAEEKKEPAGLSAVVAEMGRILNNQNNSNGTDEPRHSEPDNAGSVLKHGKTSTPEEDAEARYQAFIARWRGNHGRRADSS